MCTEVDVKVVEGFINISMKYDGAELEIKDKNIYLAIEGELKPAGVPIDFVGEWKPSRPVKRDGIKFIFSKKIGKELKKGETVKYVIKDNPEQSVEMTITRVFYEQF